MAMAAMAAVSARRMRGTEGDVSPLMIGEKSCHFFGGPASLQGPMARAWELGGDSEDGTPPFVDEADKADGPPG